MGPLNPKTGALILGPAIFGLAILMLLLPFPGSTEETGKILRVGNFSSYRPGKDIPSDWAPMTFDKIDRHTRYTLVSEEGTTVIRAESRNAASGLIRKMRIDPGRYPVIRWRWRVNRIFPKGNVRKKEGDDYPARIYITFEYDPDQLSFFQRAKYKAAKLAFGEYPPTGAISYIWASTAPKGTAVPNPYTDRVMMIAVESGSAGLNTWKEEERNVAEDYRKAFGHEPPAISGVAVMTDTDDTGDSATSFYGDILFIATP